MKPSSPLETDRPLPAQWAKIGKEARLLGFRMGLEDARFQRFVRTHFRVPALRHISRDSAERLIAALAEPETKPLAKDWLS